MKRIFLFATLSTLIFGMACAQTEDKSKRPSPPATAKETIASGATITIDYSTPSLKGRTIGKDIEPRNGEVWRAGANECTTFDISKNVTVEGKTLAAGKYSFFVLAADGADWTIIFNKKTDLWGADGYKESDDALRVKVKPGNATSAMEKLTYTISKQGKVTLQWGTMVVGFTVK